MKKSRLFEPWLRLYALCAVLGALVTGCSPLTALDWITPDSGYTLQKDVAYGPEPRQLLDVYIPQTPDPKHSVIVFFYGGRWQTGDKAAYRFVGQSLAAHGYLTIVADYRLYPDAFFPAQADDAAKAIVWAHQHAADHGGNPARLFVMGHSAGAHLAMLTALDAHFMQTAGGDARWITGVIGLAGPYDFLPLTDPTLVALFSQVPLETTQPIHFAGPGKPPALLLHGEADTTVRPDNSTHLAAALQAAGNTVVLKTYPDVDHIAIAQALSVRFTEKAPVLTDIVSFISDVHER